MMSKIKVLGVAAIIAVIGFSMIACDNGGGGDPEPTSAKYEGTAEDDSTYVLEISKASSGKAIFTPKKGDTYILTITKDDTTKTSSGTVTVGASGNKSDFELKPSNSETTFTITIEKTATAGLITGMSGSITLTDDISVPAPAKVTPVGVYDKFILGAEWFGDETDGGESWGNSINLSDFTPVRPKKGDTFKFKISGKMDKPFHWIKLEFGHWSEKEGWHWLGWADPVKDFPATFKDEIFEIEIIDDARPNIPYFLSINNVLWNVPNHIEGDQRLPEGTAYGTPMATISNFRISLVEVIPAEEE